MVHPTQRKQDTSLLVKTGNLIVSRAKNKSKQIELSKNNSYSSLKRSKGSCSRKIVMIEHLIFPNKNTDLIYSYGYFCKVIFVNIANEIFIRHEKILRRYHMDYSVRKYTKSHEWIDFFPETKLARVGISNYAQ
jgi:hypothetical protein